MKPDVDGYGQVLSSAEMTALLHQHPRVSPRVAPTLTDHSSLDQQMRWWIGSIAGLRCFGSIPVRFGRACDCCTLEEPSRAASCNQLANDVACAIHRIATATAAVMLRGTGLRDDQRAASCMTLNACGLASNPSAPITPSPSASTIKRYARGTAADERSCGFDAASLSRRKPVHRTARRQVAAASAYAVR